MTDSLSEAKKTPFAHFYRVVWRWHFYAGLFVVPFMVLLSVTGIIYLFKPQLDRLMYRNLMYVAPQSKPVEPSEQIASVRRVFPESRIVEFKEPAHPDRSSVVTVRTHDGRELMIFVNPYTAKLLGLMDSEWNLQTIAVKLHGELMIGRAGDWLIELATSWGLVLLVTGVYLWWPRKSGKLWGVLLPRLQWKNQRVFWRDVHSVVGVYGVLVVAFLLLTGLPWAGFWGSYFVWLAGGYKAPQTQADPKSTIATPDPHAAMFEPTSRAALLTGTLNTTAHKTVPWAAEPVPMPRSTPATGHEHHASAPTGQSPSVPATSRAISLDDVVAVARAKNVREGFSVTFPSDAEGVYTIAAPTDDPFRQATLHVDQYSGKVLSDVRWRDYGVAPKVTEMGIVLHEGVYFGLANQLLMLFGALTVILFAVSGTVMWWQRRPAKTVGAPAMPSNFPLWKGAVAIILVMGLLFPMVGISLLAVLLLDYLVLSRLPRLKTILG